MIYSVRAHNVDDLGGEDLTEERWRWTLRGALAIADEWERFFGIQAVVIVRDGSGKRIR